MNAYRTEFFAICPVNEARIKYRLEIRTDAVIPVEQINDAVMLLSRGFHEAFADQLHREFGGHQTLIAEHHGVTIETTRPVHRYLDQSAGGMAGTPGY